MSQHQAAVQFRSTGHDDEVRAAALQFVRKLSGFNAPSKANEAAFNLAVDDVTAVARTLLDALVTNAEPRDRAVEAQRARARAAERYGAACAPDRGAAHTMARSARRCVAPRARMVVSRSPCSHAWTDLRPHGCTRRQSARRRSVSVPLRGRPGALPAATRPATMLASAGGAVMDLRGRVALVTGGGTGLGGRSPTSWRSAGRSWPSSTRAASRRPTPPSANCATRGQTPRRFRRMSATARRCGAWCQRCWTVSASLTW